MNELEETKKIIELILPPGESLDHYPESFRNKLPLMALSELRHQKRMNAKDPVKASAKAIMSDFHKVNEDFFSALKRMR